MFIILRSYFNIRFFFFFTLGKKPQSKFGFFFLKKKHEKKKRIRICDFDFASNVEEKKF